jgi:hypothetical protein
MPVKKRLLRGTSCRRIADIGGRNVANTIAIVGAPGPVTTIAFAVYWS